MPEWNSDEDVDTNLKSKKIDDLLAEEISTKYVETQPKKPQLLKRHEREFLEDYYRSKRTEEQEEAARKKEISNKKLPASEKSLRTVASENSLGADKRP